jgi:hypothetical protein
MSDRETTDVTRKFADQETVERRCLPIHTLNNAQFFCGLAPSALPAIEERLDVICVSNPGFAKPESSAILADTRMPLAIFCLLVGGMRAYAACPPNGDQGVPQRMIDAKLALLYSNGPLDRFLREKCTVGSSSYNHHGALQRWSEFLEAYQNFLRDALQKHTLVLDSNRTQRDLTRLLQLLVARGDARNVAAVQIVGEFVVGLRLC